MMRAFPKWYDLHAHFRQGDLLAPVLKAHADMGCAGILAMPNTRPPVARILESDALSGMDESWSIEGYLAQIRAAGGDVFDRVIVPLYLTAATHPAMIESGAKSGILQAAKYYPPHGTTGAEHGTSFAVYMENGVFAAMEACGVVLCVHGEAHGVSSGQYFDRHTNAEDIFYRESLPRIVDAYPDLRIVGEHVTTKTAVDFIRAAGSKIGGTITPQHLLYTIGDLVQGLRYHLYCLPLVKFEEDRAALCGAVCNPEQTQFFAGTDSAPHTHKATACGCAAGCYTGGIAPQLYAHAFTLSGADPLLTSHGTKAFEAFLCHNGPAFYGFPSAQDTFTLTRETTPVIPLSIPNAPDIIPLPLGMGQTEIAWGVRL